MNYDLAKSFPRYEEYNPQVPVWCVTPSMDRTIHRFFDTTPFSPSGRYLGLTRLPYEDRLPKCGDMAEIVVVDLETGEEKVIANTYGWDSQLGAQVQWGATDNELLFNDLDLDIWEPFGVVINIFSNQKRLLKGTVYMVSNDGKYAISPCLKRIGVTQPGYGVVVPTEHIPKNTGESAEDGIYITEIESGKSRLLISIKEICEKAKPRIPLEERTGGDFYCFHVKWNHDSSQIMLVLRWIPIDKQQKMRSWLIVVGSDGENARVLIPATVWDNGGHHPNWYPAEDMILMNLRLPTKSFKKYYYRFLPNRMRNFFTRVFSWRDDGMRFVQIKNGQITTLIPKIIGSGHPSLHVNLEEILTDAYPNDTISYGDGTTPIRLINVKTFEDKHLIRINTSPRFRGNRNELRVDPHPSWDRKFRYIAFNALVEGTRRVMVADMSGAMNYV